MSTINTNIQSINAQRNLASSQGSLSTSMQRLSSGLRINSAKDDAAGLAISERMNAQVKGLNVAVRNANDGISLAQTAEGALTEIGSNLQRIRELAVQSTNATNSVTDRKAMQAEVNQLVSEIDRVSTQTDFNGTRLLDGSFTGAKGEFQVGANAGQTIKLDTIASSRSSDLGKYQGFSMVNQGIGTASETKVAQTVTVNGTAIALGTIKNDAKELANAINKTGVPGMRASISESTGVAGPATAATLSTTAKVTGTASFKVNGTTINVGVQGVGTATPSTLASLRAATIEAVNAESATTGVRAVASKTALGVETGVQFLAADGRNITLSAFDQNGGTTPAVATGTVLEDFGLVAASINASAAGITTAGGTLNIEYSAPAGSTATTVVFGDGAGPQAFDNTQTIASTGVLINAIDITTAEGASKALASLDSAMQSVNSSRGDLGAVQNRFSSVIASLQTNAESLSSARGRIVDADFAKETSNLSRAQILQQAGTAMVAQANQLPQGVLSLLR